MHRVVTLLLVTAGGRPCVRVTAAGAEPLPKARAWLDATRMAAPARQP